MPHKLISHNPDLKRLWDEGFEIEIKAGHLLVHHVPYLNSAKEIKYGTLVTTLVLAGDQTFTPDTHVIHFAGEHPCNKDGSVITQIQHSSATQTLAEDIIVNHSFSNKPAAGYPDYYAKIAQYATIISAAAKSLDGSVTERTAKVIESEDPESPFNYLDTNSTRAEINKVSQKLENQKIVIVGLGGTGSYILDLVAKTPVKEIHLYDEDTFLQHNAFRTPGAPSLEKLRERVKKTDYLREIYSKMHRGIILHNSYVNATNVEELAGDFVFIAIDKGPVKEILVDHLQKSNISFIDTGIGIEKVDDKLIGIVRATTSTAIKRDHIRTYGRIPFSEGLNDEYSTNIQIAELNALNAAMAVIKWKKLSGFYQDFEKEHFSTYSINVNQLLSEDY